MKKIPFLLIAVRFILAPVIVSLACFAGEKQRFLILVFMYFGLLTDIFDGIIARKTGVSSERLRRMDSQTDLVFWLSLGCAAYLLNPDLIKEEWKGILLLLVMEVLCYVVSIVKFRKETCTHAWLSKLWGLSLLLALTFLIGFKKTGWTFDLTVILGFISHVDVILIVLLLPKWRYDVPSFYHAWRIRKGRHVKKTVLFN